MFKRLVALGLVMVLCLGILPTALAQDGSRAVITPDNASQLTLLSRLGRGSAEHVAFSLDGETIAVGGSVGVWLYEAGNLSTENEPPLLETGGAVRDLAFHPEGSLVVSVDSEIQVWDIEAQTLITTFELSRGTDAFAISPDGETLVVNNGSSGIGIVTDPNEEPLQLEGSFNGQADIAFIFDGSLFAASGSDNKVYLWDMGASAEAGVFEGHTDRVYAVAFNPTIGDLATGSYDRTIRLWESQDTEPVVLDSAGEDELERVNALAFSPDGSMLASGHDRGQLNLWEATTDEHLMMIETGTGAVIDLAFSPDGTQLVTIGSDEAVQLWDVAAGTELAAAVGHTDGIETLAFNPDSTLLSISNFDNFVWLWDTATMPELNFSLVIPDGAKIGIENGEGVTFSPDGSLLAALQSFDVALWDPATGEEVHRLEGDGLPSALTFSPDSSLLAYVSSSGLYVFDVASGDLLASFEDHTDWVEGVAFSPDQTLLASASSDGTVRVYGISQ